MRRAFLLTAAVLLMAASVTALLVGYELLLDFPQRMAELVDQQD